jgi:hypothetical protein
MVKINIEEPMTMIISLRKVIEASSLPINRKAKKEIKGAKLDRENAKREKKNRV